MSGLLGPSGRPLTTLARPQKPKLVEEPRVGDKFGTWAGRDSGFLNLPGGGVMQFDLTKLTLADFRSMRQHYQLGASLNVLTFIMHQIDWRIECDDTKITDFITDDLSENWTPLVRSISQAFWAGFAPGALNFKNSLDGHVRIDKIKDLIPEESVIRWKQTLGWAEAGKSPPKIYNYDGFEQKGVYIPPENSFWYPLLMENGDHYGRKLLRPAFPSWFFSQLIHLFANRYFERFGEPLPIGRAPFDGELNMPDGSPTNGRDVMQTIVNTIRNRSTVVLPSDRDPDTKEFDYSIEYLESQMRGADFERYMSRLDEEMSLSVFTPVLLFRTADVGSYNLGQAHLRIFQQMLNAIAGDMQFYIQNYLVDRMRVVNFGQESPRARWVYRKQGLADLEQYKLIMSELIRMEVARPDLEELGAITGMTWEEVVKVTEDPEVPAPVNDNGDPKELSLVAARAALGEASVRAAREFANGATAITLGFRNRIRNALVETAGDKRAEEITDKLFRKVNGFLLYAVPNTDSAEDLKLLLDHVLPRELEAAAA